MIYSLELERSSLGGLFRNPDVFYEIDTIISENDYWHSTHKTLYSVVKNILSKGEKLDKVLVAEKIKNLGIKFKDGFDVLDYIESISFSPVTSAQTIKYFKELSLYRVRREIFEIGKNLQETVKNGEFNSFNDIISKSDSIYNQTIKYYSESDAPIDIFESMYESIVERGNNPPKDSKFLTPFPVFNSLYGGLRPKNVYAIASRGGGGKSTFLNAMAFGCHLINPKIKVLYLDTEMSLIEEQDRMAASLTSVPIDKIEEGTYRLHQGFIDKIATIKDIKNRHHYWHYQVANKNIDEVCSVVRRWFYKNVGRGNPCIIVYDYVKLTNEKLGQNWAEHQMIGEKIDKLKRISEEINAPVFTAIQMNRSGESQGKSSENLNDNSSAFALSDRLQWFASFTAIFRPKTLDEIASDGADFGTHKLIATKTRHQGSDARGFNNFLKRKMPDGSERYVPNYLNFEISNFRVTEKGSLQDIIDRQDHDYDLKDDKTPHEKLL